MKGTDAPLHGEEYLMAQTKIASYRPNDSAD